VRSSSLPAASPSSLDVSALHAAVEARRPMATVAIPLRRRRERAIPGASHDVCRSPTRVGPGKSRTRMGRGGSPAIHFEDRALIANAAR
jgi:hypothetical protein